MDILTKTKAELSFECDKGDVLINFPHNFTYEEAIKSTEVFREALEKSFEIAKNKIAESSDFEEEKTQETKED